MFEPRFLSEGRVALFDISRLPSLEESAKLREAFWRTSQADVQKLVIDISKLRRLDATLISLLVSSKNLATRQKVSLSVLVDPRKEAVNTFKQTHLNHYFDLRTRLEDILDEVETHQGTAENAPTT